MVTTTPRTWNDDGVHSPRLVEGVVEQIIDAYKFALRDEDKAGDVDSAAYNEGRREAFAEVLDLIHPAHPDDSFAITIGGNEEPIAFLSYPKADGEPTNWLFVRAGQQDLIGVQVVTGSTNPDDRYITVGSWDREEGEWEELKSWHSDEHEPLHGIEDPAITNHAQRLEADAAAAAKAARIAELQQLLEPVDVVTTEAEDDLPVWSVFGLLDGDNLMVSVVIPGDHQSADSDDHSDGYQRFGTIVRAADAAEAEAKAIAEAAQD
jgi:hypothetical protein